MKDLIASEWLKLRSVRSTWYALAGALSGIAVPALLAWNVTRMWDHATPLMRTGLRVTPLAVVAALLADLCLAVLGILSVTGEYSTGMIRTSLAAVPSRRALLLAKAAVVAAVSFVTGEAVVYASFFSVRWIIGGRPILFLTSSVKNEIPVLFCLGVGVMVIALVGLGLGFVFRSASAAIIVVPAGLLWLVPVVAIHLPEPLSSWVSSLMIPNLAGQLSGAPTLAAVDKPMLSPLLALLALTAYVVTALGAGGLLFERRDA